MKIYPISAFSDNYIWLLEKANQTIVVDPGESIGVLAHLAKKELKLAAIFLTHKHNDHVGGVAAILEKYPKTPVYGPSEIASLATEIVKEGDALTVLDEEFKVFKTAGHTEEHISFLTGNSLFCGDALFSAGCGRVFTGDYKAQYEALMTFKTLADDVKVYAGHEYTQTNLRFAQTVEPDNRAIAKALRQVEKMREADIPTLPSTIGQEKKINVFLRAENLAEFIERRKNRDHF